VRTRCAVSRGVHWRYRWRAHTRTPGRKAQVQMPHALRRGMRLRHMPRLLSTAHNASIRSSSLSARTAWPSTCALMNIEKTPVCATALSTTRHGSCSPPKQPAHCGGSHWDWPVCSL